MNYTFNERINRKKLMLAFTLLTVAAGVLSVLFGEIMFPVIAASYAMLLMADTSKNKILSLIVGITVTLASVVLMFFDVYTFSLPFASIAAILIVWLLKRGVSKGEIVVYVTLTVLALTALTLYVSLAKEAGSFALSAVLEYATAQYYELRTEFASVMLESLSTAAPELSEYVNEQIINEAFDTVFSFTPAITVISAFFITGLAFKLFSYFAFRFASEPERVVFWRFGTSSIVAYFYVLLFVLSFFAGTDGVFAITVNNLFYIFLVVFAYIGFNFALSLMTRRIGYGVSLLIIVASILLLGILTLELLSIFGVIFTHISNKVGFNSNNVNKS